MNLLLDGRARSARRALLAGVVFGALAFITSEARAQEMGARVYGFAQVDYIQDFGRVDPNWDDTLRPSRIPTVEGTFGDNGNAIIGVRQSRLGAEMTQPAGDHDLFVKIEFDFFGVGDNEGKVTPRLRHAYGTWGPILIGQTNSLFMDGDIFPNVVDYWGPTGMVFLRNPQIRWTFLDSGPHKAAVALENPSDDADPGQIRELDPNIGANIVAREEFPDVTAQYRYTGDWGHVQAALLLRDVSFETLGTVDNQPSGSEFGWGVDLTSNINTWGKDKFLLGLVFGEGIASYMNDGGVDLAPEGQPGALSPAAVDLLGVSIYYDHYWNDEFSSSIGWSRTQVDNTDFQAVDAYKSGDYASVNVLYTPVENVLFGAEALYGRREDNDGESGDDFRLQFTAKYNFSASL